MVELREGEALVDGAPVPGPPIPALRRATDCGEVAPVEGLPPFLGGAIGFLGYDAVRLVERIPAQGRDEGGLPDAWFGLYDGVVVLDRARQRLQLVVAARTADGAEAAWEWAGWRLERLRRSLLGEAAGPQPHPIPEPTGDPWQGWAATPTEEAYLAGVATAREHILAGDIFQIVLSRRWRRMPRCPAPPRSTACCG